MALEIEECWMIQDVIRKDFVYSFKPALRRFPLLT